VGRETPGAGTTTHPVTSLVTIALPPHRAVFAFSATPSHLLFPLGSVFSFYFYTLFPAALLRDCTIIQLCNYCLIVLILQLSTAFPKLHKVLRRPGFVSPGNWLQVAPVCLVRTDKNLITAL
jgi:hypothetical protein